MTLDELKRLEEAATKGSWHTNDIGDIFTARNVKLGTVLGGHDSFANAALIVALRNAAPALIAIAVIADNFCSGELAPSGNARRYQNELSQALSALTSALGGERE